LEDCRQSLSVEHAATFAAVDHLSRVLSVCNKLKDAQSLLEENVAALRKKFGNEHFNTVAAANMLANLLLHQGEYAKTEQLTSQNLAAAKRTLGPKHAETVYCLYLLLSSLNEQRKSGQEKNIGLAHVGMMSEAHHGDRDHAAGDHMSGLLLLGHSHTDPAPDDFVENVALGALERKRRAWPPEPPISVAGTLAVLGQVLVARDRAKDAEPLLRECLAIRKQALPAGHWLIAETEALLGDCLSRLGRHADAEPLLTNACPALAKAEQVLASRKVEAIDRIIAFYQRSNRPQHVLAWRGQLVSLLQDTLPNLQNARPPDDWSIAKAQNRLGACLAAMERHEEAEPILLESYATLTALSDDPQVDSGDTQRLKRDTLQQILQLRQHQGESEEATAWRTQVQVDSKPPSARTAQEAVKTWATLASHRPGKPQYQRMLAISWLSAARAARKKGQAKEALSSFAKAEEALLSLPEQSRERRWATEHLWRFASERADALAALGQHEESFVEYEKAIRMRPDRLDLLTTAAWAMANCPDPALRKPARAVELAEQAAKLDPQDPFASRVLGAAQYRAGDSKHAVETLTKAVDLQSAEDRATVCLFLAMAHWKLGDKEQARQWRDQAAQWTAKHKPSEELRRLRTEADELLGISSENKMEETAKKN
jgi:tetratricopeptide (TPR) repeat protein